MNLLPYEKISYRSKIHPAELMFRLNSNTEPSSFITSIFGFTNTSRQLIGEVERDTFNVSLVQQARKPIQLIGKIKPSQEGSEIEMIVRLPIGILVFLLIWILFASSIFFAVGDQMGPFIPLLPILGAYLFITVQFNRSANTARHRILKLLEAEAIPQKGERKRQFD